METSERTTPALREVGAAITQISSPVCELIASMSQLDAHAIGVWNSIETAVHLTQTWEVDLAVAADSLTPQQRTMHMSTDTDALDAITQRWVREDPERNPEVLAGRILDAAHGLVAELGRADPNRWVTWVGGMQLPLCAVAAHVVEESLVHGRDIARSQGRRWTIDRELARVAVERFVFAVLETVDPSVIVDREAAGGLNGVIEFRVRHSGQLYFALDHGDLRVSRVHRGTVDAHASVTPAAFLLSFVNRANPVHHVLTGKMRVWGRRPWLLGQLARVMRTP